MPRWVEPSLPTGRQSGFTLLELVLVVILVVLLFMTAWWRLMPLRGDAEAAHVATTIGSLRSALGLETAERIVESSVEKAVELEGSNPMNLLAQAPGNYLGEVNPADSADIEPGSWYFEPASGELRYRVRFPEYLTGGSLDAPSDLAWRIRVDFIDSDGDGNFQPEVDALQSVRLEALDNPGWGDPSRNIPARLEEAS